MSAQLAFLGRIFMLFPVEFGGVDSLYCYSRNDV